MKREILLERIDKLKQIMPWYVLEYYQSKLAVPYSFTTLYEYLKEYDRFFSWVLESGISDADKMSDIPLSVLENMSKKDMESFYPIPTRTTFAECQYNQTRRFTDNHQSNFISTFQSLQISNRGS